MSTTNFAVPTQTVHSQNGVDSSLGKTAFPVIENEELEDRLTCRQLKAVHSYRDFLIDFISHQTLEVKRITVGFSDKYDLPDDVVFAVYINAEPDAAMDFWDALDAPREMWLDAQPDKTKDFTRDYFHTSVRWR